MWLGRRVECAPDRLIASTRRLLWGVSIIIIIVVAGAHGEILMANPRRNKLSRKCIFCGEGGERGNPMTEEHLWPEWMHPYLPHIAEAKTQAGHHRVRLGEVIVERKVRHGHVFTKRFRLVCKRCNTGWMSGNEDDVKPILIPMLEGRAITLLKRHRIRLATWLALKVMLTECIDPFDAVINEFERDDFRLNQKIPIGLRIWVASHDSLDWYTGYWHQTLLTHLGTRPPEAERLSKCKNVQTTAIGIGHLFTLSFATTIRELKFTPNIMILRKIRRLHPPRDQPVVWPLPYFQC
jgi:hypothetical protein